VKNYVNEQFDALLTSAFEEHDAAKRAELLHEAEAVLLADNAVVPVIFNTNAYVVSDELSKVTTNYWGVQMFTKTELKDYVQYLPSVKAAAAKEQENAD
jgi:ABC-type transport system substrate-binding protein